MREDLGFDGGLTCAMECADLDASIQWYESTLGFKMGYRVDEIGWCELRSPVKRVMIGLSQVESPQVRGGATLTFGVSNVDASRRVLENKGVPFDGDTMEARNW